MIPTSKLRALRALDVKLLADLASTTPVAAKNVQWRNNWLKRHYKKCRTSEGLKEIESALAKHGTLSVRTERHVVVDSDGERRVHTLARAAVTDMFPMGTHYWVRDNAIIGARFLSSDSKRIQKVGKEILLSALSFMSSEAQSKRFEGIIRSKSASFRKDPGHWPYIFASIKDNLSCSVTEGWSHKQDAWQMVAWYVLQHLLGGRLTLRDLNAKHKRFFGQIIPFLAQVEFWRCENSGSWEEIPAVRTSVRAWEHRLIVLMGQLARDKSYSFINEGYQKWKRYLGSRLSSRSLDEAVRILDRKATEAIIADLPFESPSYKKRDARYREGDAALIYLLELDYADFLARRVGADAAWVNAVELSILKQMRSLQDARTGGISRYANDSYQRNGFFRHEMVEKLNAIYGAPSGDASSHFTDRDKVIPKGRTAAWTHFVWQLANWAGWRYLVTGKAHYRKLNDEFFMTGLRLVTGEKEASLETVHGGVQVIAVPAWRMPECYISDRDARGRDLVFPSPHTPLNWPVAEMTEAFRIRSAVLADKDR